MRQVQFAYVILSRGMVIFFIIFALLFLFSHLYVLFLFILPGEFGLTSAMRRGATRRVTFATARPLYVPGRHGNI